jgi:hypothetical protein
VLGPLELSLLAAALLIGATGTFSPCGLSAIETIGPTGHTGGRRITWAACATFLPGAVLGGVLTFGALAVLGEALHGAGGRVAYLVAAAIAVLAAVLEIRGTRIVPQIRRQLPEHWRRVMPMPLAAALYGVLLGIGFTTFVLSFGVWALAGVSLAVGDPQLGLLLGIGFGVGRAIPVVVLAPLAGSPAGIRANALMCEHPGVYLGLRRGDAAALAVVALALVVVPGSAGATDETASSATDPSATPDALAYDRIGGSGVLRSGGVEFALNGGDPAIGGSYLAVIASDGNTQLLGRGNLTSVAKIETPSADSLAVSDSWLVYRARFPAGGEGIFARNITNIAAPGPIQPISSIGGAGQVSRPSLDGATLVFGIATPDGSRIVQHSLDTGGGKVLVRSSRLLLFNPAISGNAFVYSRTDARRSRLMIRARGKGGPGRSILSVRRGNAQVWSTALTADAAYATVLGYSAQSPSARIVKTDLRGKRVRRRGPRGGGNHKF